MKEIIIHFNDSEVIFNSLTDNNIIVDDFTKSFIKGIHCSVEKTKLFCNKETQIEICFKASNYIIKHLEIKYGVKIKKYTKQNWKC